MKSTPGEGDRPAGGSLFTAEEGVTQPGGVRAGRRLGENSLGVAAGWLLVSSLTGGVLRG